MLRFALVTASAALLYGSPAASLSPVAPVVSADTSPSFAWTGTVPSGGWLRIRNLAGTVEVRRGSGNTVEVHATPEPTADRWWNGGSVQSVRFVTQRQGNDVVVCAISDDMPKCDANALSRDGDWNDDWHPQPMHVIVQLPAGVSVQAGTMHGDLDIANAGAEVIARSGHGNVVVNHVAGPLTASTGHGNVDIRNAASRVSANTGHGNVYVTGASSVTRATTGHGDVTVELASSAATDHTDMRIETGHGNINVTAPRSLSGDVDLRTGHGRVSTNFPLTMDENDRYSRNESAHGTLGGGGRSVRLSSGHGDVSLNAGR